MIATETQSAEKAKAAEIIKAEIPIIEKIIRDETWLEGERRHSPVSSDDPAVLKKVCSIIDEKAPEIVAEAKQSIHPDSVSGSASGE
jgi:hypothetical protein